MAYANSTGALVSADLTPPPPTSALFDAEVERAYAERAERAAYRLDVVTRYTQAGTWDAEMKMLAEAARFDKAHPGEPSLYDELHGMTLGLAA